MPAALLQCAVAAVKTKCQRANNSECFDVAHKTLRKWRLCNSPPPSAPFSATLCWTVATPANISIKQPAKSAQPKKGAHTVHRERRGRGRGAGCESMGQLNDAYKLPASALNAFVSVFLPRHELRFTHSHSLTLAHPALTLTLSYSLCLIRMQRRRAKSETVCQSEMTEKRRETTETSCSKEGEGKNGSGG